MIKCYGMPSDVKRKETYSQHADNHSNDSTSSVPLLLHVVLLLQRPWEHVVCGHGDSASSRVVDGSLAGTRERRERERERESGRRRERVTGKEKERWEREE